MLFTHNFLQNYGHLFLVYDVAGGGHVILAPLIEDTGINGFYGSCQHRKTIVFVGCIWNHIGGIDAGKGLIVRVFQQTAATDGNRRTYYRQEGFQVAQQSHGKASSKEMLENSLVGQIAQCYLVKLIGIHELIENVGTENNSLGNAYLNTGVLVKVGVPHEDVVNKG